MHAEAEAEALVSEASGDSNTCSDATEGSNRPDEAAVLISISGLLVAAAFRFLHVDGHPMPSLPLLQQLADEWQQRELSDVAFLVTRLFLLRNVIGKTEVMLGQLLGGLPGRQVPRFHLHIPADRFCVVHLDQQLDEHAFVGDLLPGMDKQWAFQGPGNEDKPDSWLLLKQVGSDKPLLLSIQSEVRKDPNALKRNQLIEEFGKQWQLSNVDRVMLYVTDQDIPKRKRQAAEFNTVLKQKNSNEIILSKEDHCMYFSDSFCQVKHIVHMAKRVRSNDA